MTQPGPDPGVGFTWEAYVAWLVEETGSLAAAADRLAATRGYDDDVGSVERALRRLRARGTADGGVWGSRAVRHFGLPEAVGARLRWMGSYHSRFTDLPVPVCEDLVRLWDRPPANEGRAGRIWLGLARATLALRRRELAEATDLLARISAADAPPEAVAERALAMAFAVSRQAPAEVPAWLAEAEAALPDVADPAERACLTARWLDQRAYALNHASPPDWTGAEALYLQIPTEDAPPFARVRRESGLAYCRWRLGRQEEALASAREAVRQAGDGGHVRLRAMALAMLARIADDPEARARARAIGERLEDEVLRRRFGRG